MQLGKCEGKCSRGVDGTVHVHVHVQAPSKLGIPAHGPFKHKKKRNRIRTFCFSANSTRFAKQCHSERKGKIFKILCRSPVIILVSEAQGALAKKVLELRSQVI